MPKVLALADRWKKGIKYANWLKTTDQVYIQKKGFFISEKSKIWAFLVSVFFSFNKEFTVNLPFVSEQTFTWQLSNSLPPFWTRFLSSMDWSFPCPRDVFSIISGSIWKEGAPVLVMPLDVVIVTLWLFSRGSFSGCVREAGTSRLRLGEEGRSMAAGTIWMGRSSIAEATRFNIRPLKINRAPAQINRQPVK